MCKYGFEKIARDPTKAITFEFTPTPQKPEIPDSPADRVALAYASKELPQKVLYHSIRVYLYSVAIINDLFKDWELDKSVLFTTCLLHDIGTTEKNMAATKMSFEFYGGILAKNFVEEEFKDKTFAEAVCEAVIRHQDIGDTGYITTLGFILQIATILDNVGKHTQYIHPDTLDFVNKKYSREGWLDCFAASTDNENAKKPWGHTSKLGVPDFSKAILANSLKYTK
ncbi:hypothetical protein CJJ07_003589 [Candidozyma auris]|nr:hypothetical protein CJJ07_003589 [[Candida] auris]QEL62573.1 hypothetical protein CJJ09_004752 [[Candida] auris]QRG40131.1 hypothetical protein FDK38_004595 [[Candida] auris]